jgi:perosamine synthetase
LQDCDFATPLESVPGVEHARHLYVVRWNAKATGLHRDQVFQLLRQLGVGVNVHYQPIYQHPYYQRKILRGELAKASCPVADDVYDSILSLPIFPSMLDQQVIEVVDSLAEIAAMSNLRLRAA